MIGTYIEVWGWLHNGLGLHVCRRHQKRIIDGRLSSETYIELLEDVFKDSIEQLFGPDQKDAVFQQDNSPCHVSRRSLAWFSENQIRVLDWPPQSPNQPF